MSPQSRGSRPGKCPPRNERDWPDTRTPYKANESQHSQSHEWVLEVVLLETFLEALSEVFWRVCGKRASTSGKNSCLTRRFSTTEGAACS